MPRTLGEQSAVRVWERDGVRLTFVVDGAMGLIPNEFFPRIPASYWAAHPEAPDEIEAVAFTHLHVDHTGWAFTAGDDGRPRKYFPTARYLVADSEWAPHGRGELIPGAPARSTVIEPLVPEHTEIADGEEIFPGVHALVTPGHSPGHTSYVISAGDTRVIAFGDGFHIPAQITNPGWPSRPDVDGEAVLVARATLLAELAKPDTLAFACHFGDQPFGRVLTAPDGTATWHPVPSTVLHPTPRLLGERP